VPCCSFPVVHQVEPAHKKTPRRTALEAEGIN